MPKVGVEPTWAEAHYALNVARLPVPPLRLASGILPLIKRMSTISNNIRRYALQKPCEGFLRNYDCLQTIVKYKITS